LKLREPGPAASKFHRSVCAKEKTSYFTLAIVRQLLRPSCIISLKPERLMHAVLFLPAFSHKSPSVFNFAGADGVEIGLLAILIADPILFI
jgi:hypothetical protein